MGSDKNKAAIVPIGNIVSIHILLDVRPSQKRNVYIDRAKVFILWWWNIGSHNYGIEYNVLSGRKISFLIIIL